MKRRPFQQIPLSAVLRELTVLNHESFKILNGAIHSRDALSTDKLRVKALSREVEMDEDTLSLVLRAILYVYNEIHSFGLGQSNIREVVQDLVETIEDREGIPASERVSGYDKDVIIDRLSDLLAKDEHIEHFKKAERLKDGFLPNATSFGSFVDIRPSFSDDRLKVEELIPTVQFRVRTDSDDPSLRAFIFQLDRQSLGRLKEAVVSAEEKLALVTTTITSPDFLAKRS